MVHQKRLVLDVSGWLQVYEDGSVDRAWTGSSEVNFMIEPVQAHNHFVNGVAIRDVTSASGVRVRIYLPEKCPEDGEKLPVLLHLHGGGFCISQADLYLYYQFYTRLARTARVICVSAYLRLAPEHPLPAACEDGYAALRWLGSEGQADPWLEPHADFDRVFLIGDSSGGNLVHEVAARAGNGHDNLSSSLTLAGAIPIHPGFVRSTRSKSETEQPESPFLTLDMVDKFLALALPAGSNKDHPITCPMGSDMDGLRLPPMLLCVADKDLIKDTEIEYYEALKKAGKDVELLMSYNVGHSFYLNKIAVDLDPVTSAQTADLISGIATFINKH
ncbi:hypothetical protein QQ045_016660 [Rhodiola kirilowii]